MRSIQRQRDTALLFISHDLAAVHSIANRVVVLRCGVVQEAGSTEEVFHRPRSDYIRQLLASVLEAERQPQTNAAAAVD